MRPVIDPKRMAQLASLRLAEVVDSTPAECVDAALAFYPFDCDRAVVVRELALLAMGKVSGGLHAWVDGKPRPSTALGRRGYELAEGLGDPIGWLRMDRGEDSGALGALCEEQAMDYLTRGDALLRAWFGLEATREKA